MLKLMMQGAGAGTGLTTLGGIIYISRIFTESQPSMLPLGSHLALSCDGDKIVSTRTAIKKNYRNQQKYLSFELLKSRPSVIDMLHIQ